MGGDYLIVFSIFIALSVFCIGAGTMSMIWGEKESTFYVGVIAFVSGCILFVTAIMGGATSDTTTKDEIKKFLIKEEDPLVIESIDLDREFVSWVGQIQETCTATIKRGASVDWVLLNRTCTASMTIDRESVR